MNFTDSPVNLMINGHKKTFTDHLQHQNQNLKEELSLLIGLLNQKKE